MDYREIITIEAGSAEAGLAFAGCRITVYDILGWLAAGMSTSQILDESSGIDPARYPRGAGFCGGPGPSFGRVRGMKLLLDQNLSHRLPNAARGSDFPIPFMCGPWDSTGRLTRRYVDHAKVHGYCIVDAGNAQTFDVNEARLVGAASQDHLAAL